MKGFLVLVCAGVLGAPAAAWAHSIADEVEVNSANATAVNARQGSYADRLLTDWELSDAWSLHADAALTRERPVSAANGGGSASSGGFITALALGADWLVTDGLDVGVDLHYSPKSVQVTGTTVPFTGLRGSTEYADARLSSVTDSYGALASFALRLGELDFASLLDAQVGVDAFDITQSISSLTVRGTPVTAERIRSACAAAPRTPGCAQAVPALVAHPDTLVQARLAAGFTQTLFANTDVALHGAFYLYDQDPTQVGYFSVATAGRVEDASLGEGVQVAPLLYSIRPSVEQRVGRFSAMAYFEHGGYHGGMGATNAVGLKLTYRFNRHWKLWLRAEGRKDVEDNASPVQQLSAALGARFHF